MKTFFIFILLFIGIPINAQDFKNAEIKRRDLYNLFNPDEVKSLNDVLNFFDNWVISHSISKDINIAYHTYFEKLGNYNAVSDLILNIGLPLYELDSIIILCEKSQTFDKIWEANYVKKPEIPDTIFISLLPDIDSPYGEYLKKISKENRIVKEYYESVKTTGIIDPEIITSLPKVHEYFDFKDERFRLFMAIHFITITYKITYVKTEI
ncbi:MAG: hypothetical protein JXB17_08055 [Bacteroidales bacterium]|nr:hypothetical protein [Bacteroidales bacterium]